MVTKPLLRSVRLPAAGATQDGEEESIYDVVSDDEELEAVSGVFADMLEDVDLI